MKGRHALLAGFGLGALATIALVTFNNASVLHIQDRSSAGSVAPSASPPSPVPSSSPMANPGTPGPRSGAALVYDPENKGLVLFGGSHSEATPDGHYLVITSGDTWLWDAADWRQLDVQGPPARSGAMAAYDAARHVVVLFGGAGADGTLLDDTWTWDGVRWGQMSPAHVPPARFRGAMAFDQRSAISVLFGGESATAPYTDTWTWNGEDWTAEHPASSPSRRYYPAMAYDAQGGNAVLFGGTSFGVRLNDTWTWDGATWTKQTAAAPAAKGFAHMTYDTKSQEVVAYVYYAQDNHPVAAYTITRDGSHWTNRTTSSDPSPRAEGSIAFDEATGQVVLYGGVFDQPQPFAEMWLWDGTSWSLWRAAAGE